ncbi:flagellar basal-body rod protein FlgG [Cerasibacillus quisquiliarum]|uniref:Flagellar hook-basal body complex protein FlhO n=1 Tax=Cerasibacillus quisquiliarum TaxID=227865 RepID=A0A511UZG9_9BACI|nr:flagellar hook-basal body protein [Cerasibacillus quisquiliarum]MBB5147081.1 flagellar basal-body rod protein FlgG [Cerasibacillus quisquiliarum]GEN32045.1 flagellar hook-basal body complex protein FlhO [Cerasibacillus quisquiliarum]
MLRGFYTVASGMIAQQRYQEALSNNIANANTPGYKADRATFRAFPEMLMHEINAKQLPVKHGMKVPTNRPIGSLNTGVYIQEYVPYFNQGDIRETGIDTDLALIQENVPDENGSFFFAVQNEAGDIRLTRNGNFTVDGEGYLVTTKGYYVLDNNQNRIFTDGLDFTVTPDGQIETDTQVSQLDIRYVADAHILEKEGNDLYVGPTDAIPAHAAYHIQQGFLEESNVNALQTMTQMIEAYRMFETNQRVLKAYDESMGKAVNDIGRIG